MDDIQEQIRAILGRKEQNHIQKAEPLYIQKQKCLEYLKVKKSEKEKVKDVKTKTLKEILGLLNELKSHREARLKYCSVKTVDASSGKVL